MTNCRSKTMQPWHVIYRGERIDTVYFLPDLGQNAVRSSLIRHDGYPAQITVKPGRRWT